MVYIYVVCMFKVAITYRLASKDLIPYRYRRLSVLWSPVLIDLVRPDF